MKNKLLCIICISVFLLLGCQPKRLNCLEGYELANETCRKEINKIDAKFNLDCKKGYQFNDKNRCVKTEEKQAEIKQMCPSGYIFENDKCSGYTTIDAIKNYSCLNGSLKGTKCTGSAPDPDAVAYNYYCLFGTLTSNNRCHVIMPSYPVGSCSYDYEYKSDGFCHKYSNPLKDYYCIRGYWKDTICYVNYSFDAVINYSCPSGYTLRGGKCSKYEKIDPKTVYTCNPGYLLEGKLCLKEIEEESQKSYYCDDDYVLIGQKCIKYEYLNPTR